MHLKKLGMLSVGLAMVLAGCSEPAGTLSAASKALDSANTTSISFSGTGKWYQFGQAPIPGQHGLSLLCLRTHKRSPTPIRRPAASR
jgi:hypothetical protein